MDTITTVNLAKADRATLKEVVKAIFSKDKTIFEEVLSEMSDVSQTESKEERLKRMDKLIDEDFDKYNAVFKALA